MGKYGLAISILSAFLIPRMGCQMQKTDPKSGSWNRSKLWQPRRSVVPAKAGIHLSS